MFDMSVLQVGPLCDWHVPRCFSGLPSVTFAEVLCGAATAWGSVNLAGALLFSKHTPVLLGVKAKVGSKKRGSPTLRQSLVRGLDVGHMTP